MKMNKKLLLIEMNELNFDFIREYASKTKLKNLYKIINENNLITKSEEEYENLEPWIQWTSVHTGMNASEHKIFRLGDITKASITQIFEKVEKLGYSVGCISPMNTVNRLSKGSTFIPDPWTQTKSDDSWWSKNLSSMINQTVNDNSSGKLSIKSMLIILLSFLRFVRLSKYYRSIKIAISSVGKPWRKAIFFDRLIHEININLIRNKKPQFSTVFFNSMAHIQHHYLLNSKVNNSNLKNPEWYINPKYDPFAEGLQEFDDILKDYINLSNYEFIIATGLTQSHYNKLDFYWRIKNHYTFIKKIGVSYKSIHPRMTRDFLIEFNNDYEKEEAISILSKVYEKDSKKNLFNEIEERKDSIFVTLTYSDDLKRKIIVSGEKEIEADNEIIFVAIKNGEHSEKGFLTYSNGIKHLVPKKSPHVSEIFNIIEKFFLGKNNDN